MADPGPEEALLDAKRYLEKILDRAPEGASEDYKQAVLWSATKIAIRGAIALVEHAASAIPEADATERVIVYEIIAQWCGQELGLSGESVFRAIAALCGEPDDGVITRALPAADRHVTAQLRRSLGGISVEYSRLPAQRFRRTVYLFLGPRSQTPDAVKIESAVTASWYELPSTVRADLSKPGTNRVSYELYGGN